MQYTGVQADFKLKQKNGDLIAFTAGFENRHDNIAALFSLFTADGIQRPEDFQANASYNMGDLYAQSGYNWQFKKIAIGGNVTLHQLFNRFGNKENISTTQTPFFINPRLNFKWEIKPDNLLTAYYTYNVTNSNIQQVNDAYLLTSSRSFSRGLGYFNQLENSSASVGYTTKHYLNRYSLSVRLSHSRQNDVVSYRSQLDQNSSLSQAFIMRGGNRQGINIGSHYIVKPLNGTVGFDFSGNRTVYYNQLNNSGLRKNILYSQMYKFNWASSFKAAFNFKLGSEWNFSQVKSDNVFKNTSKFTYLDLLYTVNDSFKVTAKTEHYNFGGLDSYNNYFFSDIQATYSFKKDKYAIVLDGNNLFNINSFTTYSISDFGYDTTSFRLLPRYVMVSFRYRF